MRVAACSFYCFLSLCVPTKLRAYSWMFQLHFSSYPTWEVQTSHQNMLFTIRGAIIFFLFQLHKIHLYSIFTYVSYHCLCSLALTPLLPLSCKIQEFLINFKKSPQIQCHSLVWKTCLYIQWTTLFVLGTNAYHVCFFPVPKILATLLSLFCSLCWVHWCVIWPVFFTNSYITATFFLSAPCLHLQLPQTKA